MKLFDSHCHLQDARYDGDRDAVIASARAAGVAGMLCCGTEERDWPAVQALARHHAGVYAALGLHPWYLAGRTPDWLATLEAALPGLAAIGEIGLDHALTPRDDAGQEEVFLAQLRLSIDARKPVSVHCRKAWGRLVELLAEAGPHPAGIILHAYGGSADLVSTLVPYNVYFAFGGTLTLPQARRAPEALCAVPLDRLLLETDAPDIPLVINGDREPRNAPDRMPVILQHAARLRDLRADELADITWENSCRVFGLQR
jgi:TatD DNase family protein